MIFGFDDPAATGCLPTESSRTRGERPSSASTISALAPSTSSSTGRSCLRWPWNFIPTFGSEPPAITATRWKTPALTRLLAMTSAGMGAAQKFLTSQPEALTQPAAAATDLPRLPPPRW